MQEINILAIDPGTTASALIWVSAYSEPEKTSVAARVVIRESKFLANEDALWDLNKSRDHVLAIEQVRSYGMAIGATTLDTVEWSGRFIQHWLRMARDQGQVMRIPRIQIKSHLCHSGRATDANISRALKDRFGEKGTKKNPGPTFGISAHAWAALAVATVAADWLVTGAWKRQQEAQRAEDERNGIKDEA